MFNVAALCSLALASATFVSAAPVLRRQESAANCLVVATQTGGLADEALTGAIDFGMFRLALCSSSSLVLTRSSDQQRSDANSKRSSGPSLL